MNRKSILVLCTGNSCRSQILEGWIRELSANEIEVCSAGVETHGINPDAIKYMAEHAIDISDHSSDLVDVYLDKKFDLVATVCDHAKESCPIFPKAIITFHRNFDDPSNAIENKEQAFRRVVLELKDFAVFLIDQLNS